MYIHLFMYPIPHLIITGITLHISEHLLLWQLVFIVIIIITIMVAIMEVIIILPLFDQAELVELVELGV
jgi:hypothetical protein